MIEIPDCQSCIYFQSKENCFDCTGEVTYREVEMEYLRTWQVAEILQVSLDTVYRYLRKGLLKGYKIGGKHQQANWRVKQEDLDNFIKGES